MPKSKRGFRAAIVNPLTLVGGELKLILHERGLHFAAVELLDSTGADEGAVTDIGDEAALVQEISEAELEALDIVFFCGPAAKNEKWVALADKLQFLAIDLSQGIIPAAHDTPLIAGLNVTTLGLNYGVLVAPHPATVPLALVLDRLRRVAAVRLCAATVIQPASDFDKAGIDELFQQTIQSLNMQSLPKEVFDRQLAFNLFPAANAGAVEARMAAELQAVLGGMATTVSLIQGSTFHGHSFSLFVQLEGDPTVAQLREMLGASPALELTDEDDVATTIDAGARDVVLVGRIRKDAAIPGGFWMWVVSDNLRRGAALNAVLVAETVISEFQWTN